MAAGRMAAGGPAPGPRQCPCGRRISITDEHDRCVLCLGAGHDPLGCGVCAGMAPCAARLRGKQLRALLQARPGAVTDPLPGRVSCGAAKGKATKRRHDLAFPARSQGSVPAPQPVTPLCLPAEPGGAAPLEQPILPSPKPELPPQGKAWAVPDNAYSPQRKHCHVRTKQNPEAASPQMLKPPPSSGSVSQPPPHALHPLSGPEEPSGDSQWLGMLSDLARSILLIAEAASRPRKQPSALAADPLVSSSASRMLSEPRTSSGSQELSFPLDEGVTSSRIPFLPTASVQPLSPPCPAVSPHPTSPAVVCDSSSWNPGVAFGHEDSCSDSSGEEDVADLTSPFRAEQKGAASTSENPSFPQFLRRLANLVGFNLIPLQESAGSLMDQYLDQSPSCNRVAVPLHPVLDRLVKKVWQAPHAVLPVSQEVERKYLLPEDAVGYSSQPAHKSVGVEAAAAREKGRGEPSSAPQSPQLQPLQSFGRKVYRAAAAALRVVDYEVYMARGQAELWKKVSVLTKKLPQDLHQALQNIALEGTDLARHQLQAAFDAGDTLARAAALAVDAQRSAWLQASGFHQEVQAKLENLPYTGKNLFGEQVEATLQRAEERQATLRFLRSVYCPPPPRGGAGKGKAPLHKPAFTSTLCFKGMQHSPGKGTPPQ